jgi:(5-formylfuran-3-yl)methyl phosphate synthase
MPETDNPKPPSPRQEMDPQKPRRRVSLLASVTDVREALICVSSGADIIDAKNPAAGALGALPAERIRAIRNALPRSVPVSATVGDPPEDGERIAQSVRLTAATGVDFVKVGFWPGEASAATVSKLGRLSLKSARLVAVLLADRGVDLALIGPLAEAGFAGAMLDTFDKRHGALPDLLPPQALRDFLGAVRARGMFAGLAGSLRLEHVPALAALSPDVLGFRGGLCREGARTAAVDAAAVQALRDACGPVQADAIAPLRTEHAL